MELQDGACKNLTIWKQTRSKRFQENILNLFEFGGYGELHRILIRVKSVVTLGVYVCDEDCTGCFGTEEQGTSLRLALGRKDFPEKVTSRLERQSYLAKLQACSGREHNLSLYKGLRSQLRSLLYLFACFLKKFYYTQPTFSDYIDYIVLRGAVTV